MKRPPPAGPEPLRIAYLFQQFPLPSEAFAVSDITALIEQGHRVSVYTLRPRRSEEEALHKLCCVPSNIIINRPTAVAALSWPALIWRWRKPAGALIRRILSAAHAYPIAAVQGLLCVPRILQIADEITKGECDVAHAFWSRHVGLVLPALKLHGSSPLRSAFVGAYDLIADDLLVDMTLKAAEVIYSHAQTNRAYVERKAPPGAAVSIVRRGIPLAPLLDERERLPFRCITASALTRPKNVEAVIRACAAARIVEPRLDLWIFGEGPDRARLDGIVRELAASDWVTFAGHIERAQLSLEMQRASVFVLLSRKPSERLPNVIKEALWAGCAVISSRSEGIAELIPSSKIGELVDADDLPNVSESIANVLREPTERRFERQQAGRALIAELFSSQSSMARYVESWRSATRSRLPRAH